MNSLKRLPQELVSLSPCLLISFEKIGWGRRMRRLENAPKIVGRAPKKAIAKRKKTCYTWAGVS